MADVSPVIGNLQGFNNIDREYYKVITEWNSRALNDRFVLAQMTQGPGGYREEGQLYYAEGESTL